jgi:microcystin-dependent protein
MDDMTRLERRIGALESSLPIGTAADRPRAARTIRGRVAMWGSALALVSVPVIAWGSVELNVFQTATPIVAADVNANFAALATATAQATPVGAVLSFAGMIDDPADAPPGFLLCEGQEVDRDAYPELFDVIGVAHGDGNGSSTFNVPDYRGFFLRGVSGTSGRDPDADSRLAPASDGSGNFGAQVGSVQPDEFAAHTHGTAISHPSNNAGLSAFGTGSYGQVPWVIIGISDATTGAQNSSATGGAESRPSNAYVHFIIRAE